jgi:hypothetical protein
MSEQTTRQFSLRVILTVTTGRLLTERKGPHNNGIGDLYEILNHLTGDSLFTHQLGRAGEACKPYLLQLFPELSMVNACLNKLDGWLAVDRSECGEGIKMWLTELKMMFPEIKDNYDVSPLPEGWTSIDPMIELESRVGKGRIITVAAPAAEPTDDVLEAVEVE